MQKRLAGREGGAQIGGGDIVRNAPDSVRADQPERVIVEAGSIQLIIHSL